LGESEQGEPRLRTITILTLVLMLGAALAGCASNTTPTPTTTTMVSTTPTPTTTPPTLPPPTGPVMTVTANVGTVTVIAAADRAASGTGGNVCWRVEGVGHIPHTAIHWDTVSHPNSTTFLEYAGGASFPGGAAAADPNGYDLPGVFCAPLTAGADTIHYRAHALNPGAVPAQSVISPERSLWSGAAPNGLDFVGDVPEVASPATSVIVCWQDDSLGHIIHTTIHWDTVSHPNSNSSADYAGGNAYPDNATTVDPAGYDTPGRFCTNLRMPASGAIYFRAHELVPNSVNNLSHERSIVVAPAVSIVSAPNKAAAGSSALVCWRVESVGGATHVPHTALHWDTTSHPASTAFSDYKGGAVYPGNGTAAAAAGYDLPGPFCADAKVPASGTLYLRAHVMLPGVRNEMSDEIEIQAG